MMTCGTQHLSPEAGAARSSVCAAPGLKLGTFHGFGMFHQANQAWMKGWNVRTAYSVIPSDRPTRRPLERSP
jgi:hypothetical protein